MCLHLYTPSHVYIHMCMNINIHKDFIVANLKPAKGRKLHVEVMSHTMDFVRLFADFGVPCFGIYELAIHFLAQSHELVFGPDSTHEAD